MPRTASLPSRLRRRSAALGVAAALAALSACGGSDDGGGDTAASSASAPASSSAAEDSGSSSAPAEQGGTLAVTGVDFDFEMDSTDLTAGEYEVTFTNEGDSPHNLVVEQGGEDVGGTDVIDPGASTTLTITLEPGDYVFYCGVGSHRAMGMEVPVTVS